MQKRKLGHTDISVSKICLGTMTYGEQNSQEEGFEQMEYALERGVNFFDTAEMYSVPAKRKTQGSTEAIIGNWFQKSGRRKEVILATKIVGPSPNLTYIRDELNFSSDSIQTALEGSMERLKTDYIDLYQLHWPERKNNRFGIRGINEIASDPWEDNFLEVVTKLNDLIKKGSIRTWGLSNETPWGVMKYLQLCDQNGLERPVSIQNAYNLINRSYETGMAEVSLREGIGLLAYSPMAFGLLSGKFHTGEDTPEDRLNKFRHIYPRYLRDTSYKATEKYLELSKDESFSLAQMSLAFVTEQDFTTSNIIGARTMKQLKENIDSAEIKLSDNCIKSINEVHELMPDPAP